MIKGVIFDMDGVLIDSEPLHQQTFIRYLADLGVNLTPAEHDAFIGTTNRRIFGALKESHGLAGELPELVAEYERRYLVTLQQAGVDSPIPGVRELLTQLRQNGQLLAVASSSPRAHIDKVLEQLQLTELFCATVSGNEVRESKPAPDIFLKAAELIGLQPNECLVIEDSFNGVCAAKAAGMACVGFQNPNSGNQDLAQADRIIDVYGELRGGVGEWLSGGR